MQKFKSVEQIINQLKPEKPIYCIRKNSIRSAVKHFNKNFPGKILYAVKTNPHPAVIQTIIDSGVASERRVHAPQLPDKRVNRSTGSWV